MANLLVLKYDFPKFGTLLLSLVVLCAIKPSAGNFYKTVDINFGDGRAKILEGGRALSLSMDQYSGSGFQSKDEFLYGRFDMQIKLISGHSAGSVTTFFLSSQGDRHDEIDFEFLGNDTGEPYTVHTNVYAQGKGDREQQFRLWFDPSAAFHTYSIVWNPLRIIFLIDNIPIRVYNNNEDIGVPFPKNQPMRVYCSLWNADDWATQGGRVKADWTKAPFVANYRNFKIDACPVTPGGTSSCGSKTASDSFGAQTWQTQGLDATGRNRLRWVQQKHMIYNYCVDRKRFPKGLPAECKRSRF